MTAPLAPRDATELAGIVRDAHAARTRQIGRAHV